LIDTRKINKHVKELRAKCKKKMFHAEAGYQELTVQRILNNWYSLLTRIVDMASELKWGV